MQQFCWKVKSIFFLRVRACTSKCSEECKCSPGVYSPVAAIVPTSWITAARCAGACQRAVEASPLLNFRLSRDIHRKTLFPGKQRENCREARDIYFAHGTFNKALWNQTINMHAKRNSNALFTCPSYLVAGGGRQRGWKKDEHEGLDIHFNLI